MERRLYTLALATTAISIYAALASWSSWVATGCGFGIGFLVAMVRTSLGPLRERIDRGDSGAAASVFNASLIGGLGNAVLQTAIYFLVKWLNR